MAAPKRHSPQSVYARPTAVKLATIAIAWLEQDGNLRVRQTEELRRALADAADFRGWIASGPDPAAPPLRDVVSLTRAGAKHMAKELAEEVAEKKRETQDQKKVANALQKLADKKKGWEEPLEVPYAFTGREGDGLATKHEVFTLANQDEALDAIAFMEKKAGAWETLRTQMLETLKGRLKQIKALEAEIKSFAEASRGLVNEVLALLY